MKFYDKGFITKYTNHIQVQIFSAGNAVLNLTIYEDRICTSTFECLSPSSYNEQNLHNSYPKNFLKNLFENSDKKSSSKINKEGF